MVGRAAGSVVVVGGVIGSVAAVGGVVGSFVVVGGVCGIGGSKRASGVGQGRVVSGRQGLVVLLLESVVASAVMSIGGVGGGIGSIGVRDGQSWRAARK